MQRQIVATEYGMDHSRKLKEESPQTLDLCMCEEKEGRPLYHEKITRMVSGGIK